MPAIQAFRGIRYDLGHVGSLSRVVAPPYDVNGTTASISVSDKITLPSGFALRQPPILSVEPHYDHEGPHHIEVYL